ncbi:MAG: hydrogenase expression/formation protein HypE, partial [Actinomycetota bacterium]|nr:hydrogenase expression/formation protein HypE [Actinomycetota bacterium]
MSTAEWAEAAVADHAESDEHVIGSEHRGREQQVLDRIDKARRRKARVREERITLAHGAGGKATHTLIEAVFLDAFRNPLLERMEDQAVFTVGGLGGAGGSGAGVGEVGPRLAFTTDSYVVSPLFFPGGDIGELAVNGTVNDLAMSGARPLHLSAGFILEEGFPVADLQRIVASMAAAAAAAGVDIVTGDTKVVERGKADGCFINTAGVGVLERDVTLGADRVRPGDVVLVSGPIGDHGVTIMLARGELDISSDITSDTAPLAGLVDTLLSATDGVRCLRDATRGGVATILNEVAVASDVAVVVDEAAVPMRTEVRGASEILGIDPLYVACEGRMIAIVDGAQAEAALAALRSHP